MLIFVCQDGKNQVVSQFFPIQLVPMDAYFCLSAYTLDKPRCQSIFSYSIRAHGCLFLLVRVIHRELLYLSLFVNRLFPKELLRRCLYLLAASSNLCKFNVSWVRALKCLFLLVSLSAR